LTRWEARLRLIVLDQAGVGILRRVLRLDRLEPLVGLERLEQEAAEIQAF
jgi:hypothetical protein